MGNDQEDYLSKSIKQFQRFVRQSGPAASAAYTLLGAVLFLSLIGYYLDKYFNLFAIVFFILLFGGFVFLKYL